MIAADGPGGGRGGSREEGGGRRLRGREAAVVVRGRWMLAVRPLWGL